MKHLFKTSIIKATVVITTILCLSFAWIVTRNIDKSAKSSMKSFSMRHISDLVDHTQKNAMSFLTFNRKSLEDIASLAAVQQTALQPENSDNLIDLFKEMPILGVKRPLSLYDFEAQLIYSTTAMKKRSPQSQTAMLKILEGDSKWEIVPSKDDSDEPILLLMVPVYFVGQKEGLLSSRIPFDDLWQHLLTEEKNFYQILNGDQVISQSTTSAPDWLEASFSHELPLWGDFTLKAYLFKDPRNNFQSQLFASLTKDTLLVLFIYLVITLILAKVFFVNPIQSLKEKAQHAASAKENEQSFSSPISEFNDLHNELELMLQTLLLREEDLKQANNKMESKVIKRTKELKEKAEELERATKYKSEFLARMSHEIRTPMNAIKGYTQLMLEQTRVGEDQEQLEIIENSSNSLLSIINDILDFSKIEAGMMTLEAIPTDLNSLLYEVEKIFKFKAQENSLELLVEKVPPALTWVLCDPTRLRQILINLCGNSLKFTHKGQVAIKVVECKQIDAERIKLSLAVEDTGIGMSDEQQENIFSSFSQADSTTTRKYGGTGLGLSISKSLTELLGGELSLKSKRNVGSTFTLDFCFDIAEAITAATEIMNSEIHWTRTPKLLLVEDNKVNQKLAVKVLEKYQLKPDLAVNGREALEKMAENDYDLVFMDCQMPVMNGFEAVSEYRKDPAHDMVIVAFTANAIKEEIDSCFKVGMNDYLTKPFDKKDLEKILQKWLKHLII